MAMLFENVFQIEGKLATKNMARGTRVYGERLVTKDGTEYRMWNPYRSKLAAAIKNGLKEMPIKEGSKVLYLGAASGTTASHVADIVGAEGIVYCVEFAHRPMRDLVSVCEKRENMIPIFADARMPDRYWEVGKVDVVYEDVAQPDQVRILIENARLFLKKGGSAMIAIKSQSIDVTKEPEKVFDEAVKELQKAFAVEERIKLQPYDKDHLFVRVTKK